MVAFGYLCDTPGYVPKAIDGPLYYIPGNPNLPPKFPECNPTVVQLAANDGSARYFKHGEDFHKKRISLLNVQKITLLTRPEQQYFYLHFAEIFNSFNMKISIVGEFVEEEYVRRREQGRLNLFVDFSNVELSACGPFAKKEFKKHSTKGRNQIVTEIFEMKEDFIEVYRLEVLKKYMIMELFNQAFREEFHPTFLRRKRRLFMTAPAENIRKAIDTVLGFEAYFTIQGLPDAEILEGILLLQLHFYSATNMAPLPEHYFAVMPDKYQGCKHDDDLYFEVFGEEFERGLQIFHNDDEYSALPLFAKCLFDDDDDDDDDDNNNNIEAHARAHAPVPNWTAGHSFGGVPNHSTLFSDDITAVEMINPMWLFHDDGGDEDVPRFTYAGSNSVVSADILVLKRKLSGLFWCCPFEFMQHGSFKRATLDAVDNDLWLLVIVGFTMLDPKLWENQFMENTIQDGFICWMADLKKFEGEAGSIGFKIDSVPAIIVVNPITGKKMKAWSGSILPDKVFEGLLPFKNVMPRRHHSSQPCKRLRGKGLSRKQAKLFSYFNEDLPNDHPEAVEPHGSDGDENANFVIEDEPGCSLHTLSQRTGKLYTVACSPTDATLVATRGGMWRFDVGDQAIKIKGCIFNDSKSSVAFSADGQLLASGSFDGTITIYHVASGKVQYAFNDGPRSAIKWIKWHPVAHLVLIGSQDFDVWMYNADDGSYQVLQGHGGHVTCGGFLSDGTICTGSIDSTLRIWNPENGKKIHVIKGHFFHTEGIMCMAIRAGSTEVLIGSRDNIIRVNVSTQRLMPSLTSHTKSVQCVGFASSGLWAASGSLDNKLIIWDLKYSAPRKIFEHAAGVMCLAWLGKSTYVATGCVDGKVRVWDSLSSRETLIKTFSGHTGSVQALSVSANGESLVSVALDGTVRVFGIKELK